MFPTHARNEISIELSYKIFHSSTKLNLVDYAGNFLNSLICLKTRALGFPWNMIWALCSRNGSIWNYMEIWEWECGTGTERNTNTGVTSVLKEERSCDSAAIDVCKVEEGVEEWQELVAQEQSLPHGFHRSLTPHRWILILGMGTRPM